MDLIPQWNALNELQAVSAPLLSPTLPPSPPPLSLKSSNPLPMAHISSSFFLLALFQRLTISIITFLLLLPPLTAIYLCNNYHSGCVNDSNRPRSTGQAGHFLRSSASTTNITWSRSDKIPELFHDHLS